MTHTNYRSLCFISEKVRWSVVTRLKKNTSMTEIAAQKNLSVSSVYRIMKRFYRPLNPFRTTLPKVLCFDEFKSVRGVSGAMSFIMMDGKTHHLLDIVENRQLLFLERYFFLAIDFFIKCNTNRRKILNRKSKLFMKLRKVGEKI